MAVLTRKRLIAEQSTEMKRVLQNLKHQYNAANKQNAEMLLQFQAEYEKHLTLEKQCQALAERLAELDRQRQKFQMEWQQAQVHCSTRKQRSRTTKSDQLFTLSYVQS